MGCDIHPYAEVRVNGRWQRSYIKVPRDRNYWAFGVLANVRNGYGVAGSYTGEPVTPISEPRGLPADCVTRENFIEDYESPDYVNLGDHSFSWVTLAELLALDLDTPVTEGGVINTAQKAALDTQGILPDRWCSMKSPMTKDDVHATWKRPLRESAWLLSEIIEALKPLGAPDDVRIVFGFDS